MGPDQKPGPCLPYVAIGNWKGPVLLYSNDGAMQDLEQKKNRSKQGLIYLVKVVEKGGLITEHWTGTEGCGFKSQLGL